MLNKLLYRQVLKKIGPLSQVPENYLALLHTISESYDHYEKDRKMLERSIDLSSDEMIGLYNKLRKESDDLKKVNREMRTLFENIDEVFFSVDMVNYKLLQISPACEKVYGLTTDAFLKNSNLWYELVLQEDKKIIDANHSTMQ